MALTRDKVFWDAFTGLAGCLTKATGILVEGLVDLGQVERCAREIKELEHEGDRINHACVKALHGTWITPLDREEIHALISQLDDVLDYVEAAIAKVALFRVQNTPDDALAIARVLQTASQGIATLMTQLRNVKDAEHLLELCQIINAQEHEADSHYRGGLAKLFEEQTDPMRVIKWRDIYETLEAAMDCAEDVANTVEGIVLEHA